MKKNKRGFIFKPGKLKKMLSNTLKTISAEMSDFAYILDKIAGAPIQTNPFPHVVVADLLSKEHLQCILNDEQIHFEPQPDTRTLMETLTKKNYVIQFFPGCTTNAALYRKCLESGQFPQDKDEVESFGMAYSLNKISNRLIDRLCRFFNTETFKQALLNKFDMGNVEGSIITRIQKYLTKYEISPHPDIRSKCMTYLININREGVENHQIHTQLLKFKPSKQYICEFWKKHPKIDRCWVPWNWCDKVKEISTNNTIVIFPPCSNSLHAVKLDYPHTQFQRTQFYGNIMFANPPKLKWVAWKNLSKK